MPREVFPQALGRAVSSRPCQAPSDLEVKGHAVAGPILIVADLMTEVPDSVSCFNIRLTDFPTCLVPIYDGRANTAKPFTFTEEDFQELSSWPLYRQGSHDLPADAVTAIGYTVNTFTGSSSVVLSTNIQFVILLALPAPNSL